MKRKGLPTREHWLIVGRNPQEPDVIKYFVSNAPAGTPLEWLAYVGYSRWPIERCFQEDKDELGFDHFEVRSWRSIHRHMYLTQVSHLYLNQARQHLLVSERAEKEAGFFPERAVGDDRPTYPVESLTLCQIRTALAAWFQAVLLKRSARAPFLADVAWNISYTRHRNAVAKEFHRKATLASLERRGLCLDNMRTCTGSNFAL